MKIHKTVIGFLIFALTMGVALLSLPQTVNAQTDKQNKEKKQEREDDDKGRADKLTQKEKKSVKVSMEEARRIALAKVPGTILEEDLEREKGRLQYAFDIRDTDGKVFDVEIDAMTGEVLKAAEDGDDEDGDNDDGALKSVKNAAYRVALTVRSATLKTIGKLF